MPAGSQADLVKQINTNKTKSNAKLNADGTITVNAVHTTGAVAVHSRVIFSAHTNAVTFGDGSGVKSVNVDQWLASLQ